MAIFGRDWTEDYDSLEEYEISVTNHYKQDEDTLYDRPIGGIHYEDNDDNYYDGIIKHFQD